MPPHFTYDGKNITIRRGRNHKNMRHIQGSLITRRFTFLPKNAHPNANAIIPFQMKSEISMHPKQSSKKIGKRSREHQT